MDTGITKHGAQSAATGGATSPTPASRSSSSRAASGSIATIADGSSQTTALSERHRQILEARGLDAEMLARHGVGSSTKLGSDCVVIPFREAGKVVNRKYRTIAGEKRFCQDAGARKVFWNVDVIGDDTLKDHPLIVTEGEFDAMAALQCGFPRVVSVPDGAPAEEIGDKDTAKYDFLDNAPMRDVREIILATDGDGPGINLMNDLALRLGKHRCKWVQYPFTDQTRTARCKDLNEVLMRHGPAGVTRTLQGARWVKVEGVYRMSELPPIASSRPHDIGFRVLSDHYNIRLGDFCVVTGIPSHGKSSFINEVCEHMVRRYGWTCAFASFEQKPQIDHKRNLRTLHSGKRVIHMSDAELRAADDWIDRHFSFIVPSEDDEVTLLWVLERAAASIVQHGAKIVVIDPWNEMDHVRPPDMTLTEYTGFAIKQFRKLAHKYQVHVIVAAHPAKQRKDDNGKIGIPSLYDISDSAHWYNKADVGIVVHRKGATADDPAVKIRIAKSRYHDEIGKPGDVEASFDPETRRYTMIEPTAGSVPS
jgi:twinkle protein